MTLTSQNSVDRILDDLAEARYEMQTATAI
jgi:hypothetical protein